WLLRRISNGVSTMRGAMQRVAVDGVAFWSIVDLTQSMREQVEAPHGGTAARLAKQSDFQDVSFAYGENVVVDRAKFSLPAVEVATLIGPSGAAKTTIGDRLAGLHGPTSGRVMIDDLPLTEADLARWRGKIGYIPQENILFNDTVLENITLADPEIGEAQA